MIYSANSLPEISYEEVAKHTTSDSLWIIHDGRILDLTSFVKEHPGGEEPLMENAGKDGTVNFRAVQHSNDAIKMTDNYVIGVIQKKNSKNPFLHHLPWIGVSFWLGFCTFIILRYARNKFS